MEEIRQMLEKQNIKYTYPEKKGAHYRSKWRKHFASHLTLDEQERIFMLPNSNYSSYLWHVFSWEKKRYYAREAANEAFNKLSKKKCIIFHQFSKEVLIIDDARDLRAELFKPFSFEDIYIVDEAFTWSYNITHESSCGPYYAEASWTE